MKFHFYSKHRTAAHVKVPLATPEVIEFNESMIGPFSVQQHYDSTSRVHVSPNTNETSMVNSSSLFLPGKHENNTQDQSITDSSKQTRGVTRRDRSP
jgi:hypothetical protein